MTAFWHKHECQSRFMPYLHALICLQGGVLETPDDVDSVIGAEMPREADTTAQLEENRKLVKTLN